MSAIDDLIEYVRENGGEISKISFRATEGKGNGIIANETIQTGDILISIPYSLCISVDALLKSPLGEIVNDQKDLLNYPDELLCMALLYSITHSTSPWKKHVQTLPLTLNLPIYWSVEELQGLKNSMIYHLTLMMKKRIETDWENIYKPLSEVYPHLLGSITIENYTWALGIVYSRAVGFRTAEGTYVRCIPPLIDMANHNTNYGTETADTINYDVNTNCLIFYNSKKTIMPGNECYAVYGDYSNSKLLYSYGFVLPYASPKTLDIWPSINSTISNCDEKRSLLHSQELTAQQTYDFVGTVRDNNYISPALLSTLRVLQATSDELEMIKSNIDYYFDTDNADHIVNPRNEKAALNSLRDIVTYKLSKDVEDAESDRKQLGDILLDVTGKPLPLDDRRFLALVIRVEERELLQECFEIIEIKIAQINMASTSA